MTWEKIGKGEALLWLSGGAGVKAFTVLAALVLGWQYAIPGVIAISDRLVYQAAFVASILVAYVLYRIGASGEKPQRTASLWFAGFFGLDALSQLCLAVLGWTFLVTNSAGTPVFTWESTAQIVNIVVSGIISIALWKHAKNDLKLPSGLKSRGSTRAKASARRKRR